MLTWTQIESAAGATGHTSARERRLILSARAGGATSTGSRSLGRSWVTWARPGRRTTIRGRHARTSYADRDLRRSRAPLWRVRPAGRVPQRPGGSVASGRRLRRCPARLARPISNRGGSRRPGRRRCDGCRRTWRAISVRVYQCARPGRCAIASRQGTTATRTRSKSRRSATTARGCCSPRKANAPPLRDRASRPARGYSWLGRAGLTWRCARA